ncbi:cation transporter [Malacoplasma penetrans]|uniref:Heavy-metal transporting ATPase, partial n=1 Tax=Malacoplasma penetrans (strain HF-2) TaxID=272633 RepID=Q8EUP8_MALP2|nr:heavy-metal-associated domain-containing protein [Malacoplasma penetrans]RXY97079.1 cation transporter [Malacoplasma penetrans]BAC44664.1 heavy-metal transporting ATPase [Malacoplasma penetrans HF-2]
MTSLNLFIKNLECNSCAVAIEKTLSSFNKNELSFSVIIASKKLKINFDESKINKEEILKKLNDKKFEYEEI